MRIGIYGGTFNPIHRGHLTAAAAAAKQLCLDKLLLVPDAIPPHKPLPAGSADAVSYTHLECQPGAAEGPV